MQSKYKIVIPKPCHENWDRMLPNTQGKFCGSCQKNVIDFTNKSAVEIQNYFAENIGKNICGRFEKTQLSTITIQIPQQLLFRQVHFHKMFLLALLIAMGTSLFSCSDDNGNKQKIDKVEVVEGNSTEGSNSIVGMLIPPDPTHTNNKVVLPPPPPPPPAPKIDEVKFVKSSKGGKVEISENPVKKPLISDKLTGEVVMVRKDSIK